MKNEYLLKMFLEFSNAYGIKDTFNNFSKYKDLFYKWACDKQTASINYVQLFDYMRTSDEIDQHIIAEFGKGKYDTTVISMNSYTPYKAIAISPYAETINFTGIETYKGKLSELSGQTFVKYDSQNQQLLNPNCNLYFNDEINTLMTQIPFTTKELKCFLNLINSNKTLFIGAYGSVHDEDKQDNIEKLKKLHKYVKSICSRDIQFCLESQNGTYLSAIKINTNEKSFYKVLSR